MTKTDIYVCSKPLQYFNARNVPSNFHPTHKRALVMISNFYKADEFYKLVTLYDNSWSQIVRVTNVKAMYRYLLFHSFQSLIYGYDTSTVLGLIHLLKKFDFFILEEGMSTYFPLEGYDRRKNVVKDFLDKITGVSTHWGHTKFVKGAFVYYPDLYKKLRTPSFPPTLFEKSFVDKMSDDVQLILRLSNAEEDGLLNIQNSKILLYITNWQINQTIIKKMLQEKSNYDYLIIKPHPHIRNCETIENSGLILYKTNLMAEALLSIWSKKGNDITIYHEGSTAIFYFGKMIKAEDLSPDKDEKYHRLIRGDI